jgi:hypothetical protein
VDITVTENNLDHVLPKFIEDSTVSSRCTLSDDGIAASAWTEDEDANDNDTENQQ